MATSTAKSDDGMYLIFQSSSDGKIYTIPQGDFGAAIDPDSDKGKCILEHFRLLKSNLVGAKLAALISADDGPIKTCGPSGPPPPPGR